MEIKIFSKVNSDLDPSFHLVLAKLLAVHSFIGTLTLSFCPQFGLSLTNDYSLFHYLHRTFGEQICMIMCGGIFLGSGAMFASLVLGQGDLLKLKTSKFLYYFAIASLFLTGFWLRGVEIYLEIAGYWLIGAVLFGILTFDVSLRIRSWFAMT